MKLQISLSADGVRRIAESGKPEYNWDFSISISDDPNPPGGGIHLSSVEVDLPSRDQCIEPAVAKLRKEIAEVQAEAMVRERELNVAINNLLAIGYTAPEPEVVADDGPLTFQDITESGHWVCLKTGCYLAMPCEVWETPKMVWGDLHVDGGGTGKFLFNAVRGADGKPAWQDIITVDYATTPVVMAVAFEDDLVKSTPLPYVFLLEKPVPSIFLRDYVQSSGIMVEWGT